MKLNKRQWRAVLTMGTNSYQRGEPRASCPFFDSDSDTMMDPMEAKDPRLAGWLFAWDEAEVVALEEAAFDLGADAGIRADLCPYDIEDYRLREAWIEGWLVSVCWQVSNCAVAH